MEGSLLHDMPALLTAVNLSAFQWAGQPHKIAPSHLTLEHNQYTTHFGTEHCTYFTIVGLSQQCLYKTMWVAIVTESALEVDTQFACCLTLCPVVW